MRRFLFLATSLSLTLQTQVGLSAEKAVDPYFKQQWALHNDGSQAIAIDVDPLHSLQQEAVRGVDIGWLAAKDEAFRLARAPVTVAVIDSGVDSKHVDLLGRALEGWDFLTGKPDVSDVMGHGTHISGIIAANADNGVGIAGVAPPSVKILPLRVLSTDYYNFMFKGKRMSDYVADAVRYAVSHGAQIINISLGWPQTIDTENARQAIKDALKSGALIIASAGNDRKDQPTYPCAYEGVICVGAVSNNGTLSMYSNRGAQVDILAPGDEIISTYPIRADFKTESQFLRIQGYEMLSGTSEATPYVTGIAAVLKSIWPQISPNELRARLLISAAPVPRRGGALYGSVSLAQAMKAKPQAVYLPHFKKMQEIEVNEDTLQINGSLDIENLWLKSSDVQIAISVNGKNAGMSSLETWSSSQIVTVPWKYQFASLDESSELELTVTISPAPAESSRIFRASLIAVRGADKVHAQKALSSPQAQASGWVASADGLLSPTLKQVPWYGKQVGLAQYYQQMGSDAAGAKVQVIDPGGSVTVSTLDIPGVDEITQVMRLDAKISGKMGWLITGSGQKDGGKYFQFYFLDGSFRPLWGSVGDSTWRIPLNGQLGEAVKRDYSLPGSWLNAGERLVPSFISVGPLPGTDGFDALDKRFYQTDLHLYYLEPQPRGLSAVTSLRARALDGSRFRGDFPIIHVRSQIPQPEVEAGKGHLKVFLIAGDDLDAQTFVWDIRSSTDYALRSESQWTALSASGDPYPVMVPQNQAAQGETAAFVNFYDEKQGAVVWSSAEGKYASRSKFKFSSVGNNITGFIGAFETRLAGRVWFLESQYDVVAFHQASSGQTALDRETWPINWDSSFQGNAFRETFIPMMTGTSENVLPGIYVDSTRIRGRHVGVIVWDPSSKKLTKPLRYSLLIPRSCAQLKPLRFPSDSEYFALPMLCQENKETVMWVVHPSNRF